MRSDRFDNLRRSFACGHNPHRIKNAAAIFEISERIKNSIAIVIIYDVIEHKLLLYWCFFVANDMSEWQVALRLRFL